MTHASPAAIKRAWNTLTAAVRPPAWFGTGAQIETISVASPFGLVCHCEVVWLRLRGHWHVAFLNIPGEVEIPTSHIETLATSALKLTRATLATLTVWDVEMYSPGKITLHRVKFTLGRGRKATNRISFPDTPPTQLWAGIAEALRLQSRQTAAANAIR